MVKILLLIGLLISSVQDIREKKIWLPVLWGITIVLLLKKACENQNSPSWLLCSLFSILFFLALHRLSGRQIGVGDAFLFGMTGAGLGWRKNFVLIYVAFFLVFILALFLVAVRKKDRKYEIPLSPFVLLAYFLVG